MNVRSGCREYVRLFDSIFADLLTNILLSPTFTIALLNYTISESANPIPTSTSTKPSILRPHHGYHYEVGRSITHRRA